MLAHFHLPPPEAGFYRTDHDPPGILPAEEPV
jgi:hypothetical protein